MTLREYWVNVYLMPDGGIIVGGELSNRASAITVGRAVLSTMRSIYRIHVRIKPPGAPARYSSEHDRRNWEQYPEEMRKCPF